MVLSSCSLWIECVWGWGGQSHTLLWCLVVRVWTCAPCVCNIHNMCVSCVNCLSHSQHTHVTCQLCVTFTTHVSPVNCLSHSQHTHVTYQLFVAFTALACHMSNVCHIYNTCVSHSQHMLACCIHMSSTLRCGLVPQREVAVRSRLCQEGGAS